MSTIAFALSCITSLMVMPVRLGPSVVNVVVAGLAVVALQRRLHLIQRSLILSLKSAQRLHSWTC